MPRMMILLPLLVLLGVVQFIFSQSGQEHGLCDRWRAMIDPHVKSNEREPDVENVTEREAMEGIACLLTYQGNQRAGKFSGATRFDISQTFPDATIELDALYTISAIYYGKWKHARGIALVDQSPKILKPKAGAKRAFPYLQGWFQRLKAKGLERLRSEHDDPLNGSGLRWY